MTSRTAILLALLACWTWQGRAYGYVWQSNLSLWAHTSWMQPYNLWVQKNYQTALFEANQFDAACVQLEYVQRLAASDRAETKTVKDRTDLDAWVLDRLLALAYRDHQDKGSTACRNDSVLSADLR